MQKKCAIQPQINRKRTTANENQTPRRKKADGIIAKEAKVENATPAIRKSGSFLHGLQSLMG